MTERDTHHINILAPEQVSLNRTAGGMLQGSAAGTVYEELMLYRAFPVAYPNQYISLRDKNGAEIGIIVEPNELDAESRRELLKELRLRYFLPQVSRIVQVRQHHDLWIWKLETDAGLMRMTMRNLHEHVQVHGASRLILTGVNGRRAEIRDLQALDAASKKWLKDVL